VSRVLVIGATGLLGRPVAEGIAARGHNVHRASRRLEPGPDSHVLDLANLQETSRALAEIEPEVVVQMTGGVASDPTRLAEINLIPTINLIRALASSVPSAALFISGSAAEYGAVGDGVVTEGSPLLPVSPYGWVKMVETTTARELARLEGLSLTVVRPFNPITPDLPRSTALGNFRSQILAGEGDTRRVVCGRVDIVRDYVTGEFVGQAMAELVENPPGGVVNICSGVGHRLDSLMFAAAGHLGVGLALEQDEHLANLPAPASVVGDPARLGSLVRARPETGVDSLAAGLLGEVLDQPFGRSSAGNSSVSY
jgi:nucleoside-diphosphate-sugar epimerase